MLLAPIRCPDCDSEKVKVHTTYTVQSGDLRSIYYCPACQCSFSETYDTPLAGLHTPLSRIQLILEALQEGLGVNAACRTFHVSKNTLTRWMIRLAPLKESWLLYALCHRFLQQLIEGDELYTKVEKNVPPPEAEGWTVVLMERASRFVWELHAGRKDRALFTKAMQTLAQVLAQTADLTLVTDGERRYGAVLFEICQQVLRTGQRGRPKTTLPKGVRVRIKNKGSQSHRRGRKRPKYQAPQPEHPDTLQNIEPSTIQANHLEAFNSALRRRLACYRRKTNTYAKHLTALQRRLDVYWLWYNFIRVHFTTGQVPAVALGILDQGLSVRQFFQIRYP
jgi:transposase-like protein